MGIASGETAEDAYERDLDAAYAEADRPWFDMPLAQAFGLDWDDEFDDDFSERARAAMESASAYQLWTRLEGASSAEARRSRCLTDTLDLLRAADRLASWAAARQAALIAEVFDHVRGLDHDYGLDDRHGLDDSDRRNTGRRGSDLNLAFTLAAQEIAPLLRVPGRTAQRMLSDALHLTEELPATWAALDEGRISPVQAQVIVEESGSIPTEAITGFEEAVLRTAGELTRPKLTRRCRRLREELHPESITVRKERAARDRTVTVQSEQDGMAWLSAYLPAEQAHGIFIRVDTAARSLQAPDEARTLSQLRADVFADVMTHTCTGDPKKGTGFRGVGASVFVTVPVMTLLGHKRADWQNEPENGSTGPPAEGVHGDVRDALAGAPDVGGYIRKVLASTTGLDDDLRDVLVGATGSGSGSGNTAPDLAGCENGLLEGYGPIDPETARNLAAHAPSFTRILVHPETGAVLSVGRDRYRPPKHLQDWVRITNPTCVHPGCNRSSWSCEIDHVVPWAHGGKTELENLQPRCKLHHMLKTEGIWPATQHDHAPDNPCAEDKQGTAHLTSLGGQTYTTVPEPPPPF